MTMSKVTNVSAAEAKSLRALLKCEGFERVAGSGRGLTWTRHIKGDLTIFVEQSAETGRRWVSGFNSRTNRHFTVTAKGEILR